MFLLGAGSMGVVAWYLLKRQRRNLSLADMYSDGIFARDIADLQHALDDVRAVQVHRNRSAAKPTGVFGPHRAMYHEALQQVSHERNDWYQHCLGVHSDIAELESLYDTCETKCLNVTNADEFSRWVEDEFLPAHRRHTDSLQDHVVQGAQVRLRVIGARRSLRMKYPIDPAHADRCQLSANELEREAQEITEEIAQLEAENALQAAELSAAQAASIGLASQVQALSSQLLRVREHLMLELDSATGKLLEAKRIWDMRQANADSGARARYDAARSRTELELERIRAEAHNLQVPKRRAFGHTLAQAYGERHELVSQKVQLQRDILLWGSSAGLRAFSDAFQELHQTVESVHM